jgi:hypothetical protein
MNQPTGLSRRQALATAGTAAAGLFLGSSEPAASTSTTAASLRPLARPSGQADDLAHQIARTPFIDTHEHLVEEERRTQWTKPEPRLPCHDWALLFSHYLNSDLQVAGLPAKDQTALLAPTTSPERKWALLEPYWPAVKNTGYGQVVRLAAAQLYGIDELNARTARRFADRYTRLVKPGFYASVLHHHAGVESCQVNSLEAPFSESRQPLLLMQDISILTFGSVGGDPWTRFADATGRQATDLAGWHRVIDDYFARYGPYAVAVKTQIAYQRRLDFADVPAEQAAEPFRKLVAKELGRRPESRGRPLVLVLRAPGDRTRFAGQVAHGILRGPERDAAGPRGPEPGGCVGPAPPRSRHHLRPDAHRLSLPGSHARPRQTLS